MDNDLQYSNLEQKPELYNDVLSLIHGSFHYSDENRFDIDFYPLMNRDNWSNLHVLSNSNEIISHIGVCKRKMLYRDKETFVCFIGGIAVNEKYRGQGHFKQHMSRIIDHYKDSVSLFFLWGNLADLYSKFGFVEAGLVFQSGDRDFQTPNGFKKTKLAVLTDEELEQIKCLYNDSHIDVLHPIRDKSDWEKLKGISSSDLYIEKSENRIQSYFFVGKGQDLTSIIHEFSSVQENRIQTLLSENKLWDCVPHSDKSKALYSALIRPGNPKKFSELISIISNKEIIIENIQDNVTFIFEKNVHELELKLFLQGIFGPDYIQDFSTFSKSFWISGLDSI